MSWQEIRVQKQAARKPHQCIWCGERIQAAEEYIRVVGLYEGDFQNQAWHPECNKAFLDELAADGECSSEIYPCENERPKKEKEAACAS